MEHGIDPMPHGEAQAHIEAIMTYPASHSRDEQDFFIAQERIKFKGDASTRKDEDGGTPVATSSTKTFQRGIPFPRLGIVVDRVV